MTVLEILEGARRRITSPEAWTKGCYARTAGGNRCESRADIACQWCAAGAVLRDAPSFDNAGAALRALDAALRGGCIVRFNDAPATTHAEVLAVYDRAIATERAKAVAS